LKDQILFKQLRSCGPVAPTSPAERAQAALPSDE